MTVDERLEKIEAMLAVLVERQAVREWYTTHEFARTVGKAEFTIREYCRLGRLRAEKRQSGRERIRNGCSPMPNWNVTAEMGCWLPKDDEERKANRREQRDKVLKVAARWLPQK